MESDVVGWFWELYWKYRWIGAPLTLLAIINWGWKLWYAVPLGRMYVWTAADPDFVSIPEDAERRWIRRRKPTRSRIPAMLESGYVFVAQPRRVDSIRKYEVEDSIVGAFAQEIPSPQKWWVGRTGHQLLPSVGNSWLVCTRW